MQKKGLFVSFEGISGVGKSYFSKQLQATSQDLPIQCISEIIDRQIDTMDSGIISLLRASGDRFFQSRFPLTTTFLLFAHVMHDAEARIRPALTAGSILIKDRYIDSVAVYQALLLCPDSFERQIALANELYHVGVRWCPTPDITFLIEDDFDTAIGRAQERNGDCYRADELAILRGAARLYDHYAQQFPSRIVRLNRQSMSNHVLLHCLRHHLNRLLEERKGNAQIR